MPVTPRFSLRQDDDFVIVEIKVPYVSVTDLEFVIQDHDFSFYCKPYLLKLTLPGAILDDEHTKAQYDFSNDHGTVTVFVSKASKGEKFQGLDMLTAMMQPRGRRPAGADGRPARAAAAAGQGEEDEEAALVRRLQQLSVDGDDRRPQWMKSRPKIEVVSSHDFADEEHGAAPASGEAAPPASAAGAVGKADTNEAAAVDIVGVSATGGAGATGGAAACAPRAVSPAGDEPGTQAGAEDQHDRAAAASPVLAAAGEQPEGHAAPVWLEPAAAAAHEPVAVGASATAIRYGFANRHSGFFADLQADFPTLVQLPQPDSTPASQRHALRLAAEERAFDPARWVGDELEGDEDPIYQEAMGLVPHWIKAQRRRKQLRREARAAAAAAAAAATAEEGEARPAAPQGLWFDGFTTSEREAMAKLPNEEFLFPPVGVEVSTEAGAVDATELRRSLCQVLCVLIAYCYDHRTTGGEPNVESGWTVAANAPVLSWLCEFDSPSSTMAATARSLLTFPYMRRWDLAKRCCLDAAMILGLGRRVVLRCLLAAREVVAKDDQRYLLNSLFLTPMCVWIQQLPGPHLEAFARECKAASKALEVADTGHDLQRCFEAIEEAEREEEAAEEEAAEEVVAGGVGAAGDEGPAVEGRAQAAADTPGKPLIEEL